MKQGIVKFSKEFITPTGLKEWVGIEWPVDFENDNVMGAFNQAKKAVCDFQLASGVLNDMLATQIGPEIPLPSIDRSEDRRVGLTPELIMSCEDIVTLQSFYMLVEKSNRVDLKEAYDKRKIELVEKETKEILTATEENIKHIARKISKNAKNS